ncbi:MAG TPA: acyltransferase [Agriterribacter sp.]|nr:acyltransferase [Agriterribacter sp.]
MSEKVYFKNLHGFRFIAAALVIISHIELFKLRVGLRNHWHNPFIFEAGGMGVDFFFVLSGFLITTLLLKELEATNKIAISKFYMRRILRIWPLYYLIIILCYFIIPYLPAFYISGYSEGIHQHFWGKLIYSIFFMPNAALAFFKEIPYAAPIWSVGVEEQFYLFWPLLLLIFPRKLSTIIFFIIAFIVTKVMLVIFNLLFVTDAASFAKIKELFVATRMECMGIGGLGAWLIYKKQRLGHILKNNITLVVALVSLPVIIVFAKKLFELHHIIFSVLFLIIIVNGATNSRTPIKLENKLLLILGNISYGLYLWHSICIGFLINFLRKNEWFHSEEIRFNGALYIGTFLLSIFIAWLSYTYLETPFLKLKSKFSVIVSGSEARMNKAD